MRVGALGVAGIGAAVVFTLGWIVAGAVVEQVDAVRNTLSDLGARPVGEAWIWNGARTASGILVVAVSAGLWRWLPRPRGVRAGTLLLGLFGVAQALAFLFRRDCPSAGGSSAAAVYDLTGCRSAPPVSGRAPGWGAGILVARGSRPS